MSALYEQANRRLESLLCRPGPIRPAIEGGAELVTATRALLDRLGAPDRAFRCVLVGGTSGKGSVAALLAAYLQAAGVRVGLHTSPYLQVATEKIQIDGLYIRGETFAELVDWIWPELDGWREPGSLRKRSGAVSLVLAAEAMRRAGVEVGIFEVGSGGRFDPVNALTAQAVAITGVGLDHLALLGPALKDIAWHKAGLIKSAAPVITAAHGLPLAVIEQEAQRWGATIQQVAPDNRLLAQALFAALHSGAIPVIPPEAGRLPGRLEPMGLRALVWLDAAHNSEKLAYLARQLRGRPTVALFGSLAGKPVRPMLKILSRLARQLVLAPVTVQGKLSADPAQLEYEARGLFDTVYRAPSPDAALALALHLRQPEQIVLATGSLYLVGQLRSRWYPPERVLLARHSWPDASGNIEGRAGN
ncbi:bifunctional folylpolyglutamate synthase/dihydrofolate synthase [Gloeobacter kilaueensis]|uniref:tetrahydrofolate synthase n=1 Tax=Gloeobacter kilaueensis (strain ATCC BAA-2537 / CCAP 1431/1 / ULC 316 / JS1) TaxID=1183438 RepID=U5QCQ6_GLOK1|nr:Mur ligase family protein [Gloeobacter kilaueensis]AGY56628.1 FolC bifunctional protein [Gloeobacter kilaueensis JS1]